MDNDLKQRQDKARQAGYSEDQIAKLSYEYTVRKQTEQKQPQTTPVTTSASKKEKGFRASDLLPIAGGVGGAVLGSLAGPGGTILGGGAGAAGGEALRQKIEGESDTGRILTEGALGAVPVGRVFKAGKVAGKTLLGIGEKEVSKKVAKKAGESLVVKGGKAVEGVGKKLGLRAIKAAPTTDQANFMELTGQALEDFQATNKLYGSTGQILKKTDNLIKTNQNTYNDLVRTGQKVPVKDFVTMLKTKAKEMSKDELGKTLSPEIKATANALKAKANFIAKQADKKGMVAVDKIVEAKGATFKNVTAATMRDAAALDADKLAGGIGIEYLDQFAPGSAKLGKYLQGLREFEDIVKKRAGKGEGSQLFNIHKAGFAGAAGGALLGGGIPGALLGVAAGEAANSPYVISKGAQALQKVGRGIAGAGKIGATPVLSTLPGQIAGQTVSQTAKRVIAAPFRGGEELPASPTGVQFPEESMVGGPVYAAEETAPVATEQPKPYTQEQLEKAAAWDLQNNGGKGIGEIKQLYDLYYGQGAKKQTEAQVAREDTMAIANSALEDLSSKKINIGFAGIGSKIEEFKGKFDMGDPDTLAFNAKIASLKASIAKARAGTSFTPNEEKLLNRYSPNVGDSRQQIETKLNGLVQFFTQRGNVEIGPSVQLPESPTQVTF